MVSVPDIGPQELKRRLDAGEALTVLDVREPWEIKLASLPGTLNIPLNEVPGRLGELNPHAELVVMCHAGGRSRRAAEFLSARGFTHVANLAGGIDAWSRDIDPDLPTY
jgi:rhodanese-related sulfurtransferase